MKNMITEEKKRRKAVKEPKFSSNAFIALTEKFSKEKKEEDVVENTPIYQKNFLINEELNTMSQQLSKVIKENDDYLLEN